mmetsp:Transcript_42262/g.84996  ORF Transcript_42262/g.84996 Transcript_42262/m.84996 type:complete len:91 (-) Transcript_42262:149-421(-)
MRRLWPSGFQRMGACLSWISTMLATMSSRSGQYRGPTAHGAAANLTPSRPNTTRGPADADDTWRVCLYLVLEMQLVDEPHDVWMPHHLQY